MFCLHLFIFTWNCLIPNEWKEMACIFSLCLCWAFEILWALFFWKNCSFYPLSTIFASLNACFSQMLKQTFVLFLFNFVLWGFLFFLVAAVFRGVVVCGNQRFLPNIDIWDISGTLFICLFTWHEDLTTTLALSEKTHRCKTSIRRSCYVVTNTTLVLFFLLIVSSTKFSFVVDLHHTFTHINTSFEMSPLYNEQNKAAK